MASGSFEETRKTVFRQHKRTIVKSALNGYKTKGRGLVLLKLTDSGAIKHLSYLTLDGLNRRQTNTCLNDGNHRVMLIDKISTYSPSSEVLVMITNGEFEQLLVGSRQVTH
jgi:hypothetical protein